MPVIRHAALDAEAGPVASPSPDVVPTRLGPVQFAILSAWCGLVSGLLEVVIRVVRHHTIDLNHFYRMSRHFIWVVPLTDLAIFVVLGGIMWLLTFKGGRRAHSCAAWLLGALTLLPPFWVAFPGLYGVAVFVMVLGGAARLVPALERRATGFRRLVRTSFPVVAGVVAILAASPWCADQLAQWRERARPPAAPGSPNILLIVLDTVAADHLSLHGYNRRTSPAIDEIAKRGVRFDRARSTASWTLLSHASMFTGKWPHELSAGWYTPLDGTEPTVAEFLATQGYATAGFIANFDYCSRESGLARGFTVYRDYIFPGLTALRMATLVERPVNALAAWRFLDVLGSDSLTRSMQRLWCLFTGGRKRAEVVNREFLDWLARRPMPDRPFFAFLNFIDAHHPYRLRKTGLHRFGTEVRNRHEAEQVDCLELTTRGSPEEQQALLRDCYDDCLADLDEQVGKLFDELDRRGVLDQTWLIITADHGESFGEHPGVVQHGSSLYQTELHVPLVLIAPGSRSLAKVVTEVVSGRDLAATIADLAGLKRAAPFPGKSLARFWEGASDSAPANPASEEWALSEIVPHDPVNPPQPERVNSEWPLAALSGGDWTYIRREGDIHEELYQIHDDAEERHNLAADPAMRPVLERMRQALGRLTGGPLVPRRFNP